MFFATFPYMIHPHRPLIFLSVVCNRKLHHSKTQNHYFSNQNQCWNKAFPSLFSLVLLLYSWLYPSRSSSGYLKQSSLLHSLQLWSYRYALHSSQRSRLNPFDTPGRRWCWGTMFKDPTEPSLLCLASTEDTSTCLQGEWTHASSIYYHHQRVHPRTSLEKDQTSKEMVQCRAVSI